MNANPVSAEPPSSPTGGAGGPVDASAAAGTQPFTALPVLVYDAGMGVRIEAAKQRDGTTLWKVLDGSNVLSIQGEWDYEPQPSQRGDEFFRNYRFPTPQAALDCLNRFLRLRPAPEPLPAASSDKASSQPADSAPESDLIPKDYLTRLPDYATLHSLSFLRKDFPVETFCAMAFLYTTFVDQVAKRGTRSPSQWAHFELHEMTNAARLYALGNDLTVLTEEDTLTAEKKSIGHPDYGSRLVTEMSRLMCRPTSESRGPSTSSPAP
jgi:hypothetical protein